MKGHLKERSPGRWAIVLEVRDEATGNRKRRWHSFKGTKREAQHQDISGHASGGAATIKNILSSKTNEQKD